MGNAFKFSLHMVHIEVRMFSIISIICELQLWATGCPFGYLPTFDSVQGALYRSCTTTSECMSTGAECKWSPVTATSVCCKINPTFFSPLEEIIYIYPYIGYQEAFNVTDVITRPTTNVATTATSTTTARTTTLQSTTVSRIVNITATASGSIPTTTRMSIPQILLSINTMIATAPAVFQLIVGRYLPGVTTIISSSRVGSVTLICDNGYNILVDTGINYRQNEMLAALAMRGVHPTNIHTVIITHGHPDHFGGGGLFPSAQFIFGPYLYRGDQFRFSGLNMAPTVRLSLNCDLWNTPGHTPDSLTVMVKNVPGCGTIAVTGDLFINQNDLVTQSLWRDLAWDFVIQQQSRNLILCQVCWIVPGHGQMFQVTDQIKQSNGCPTGPLSTPSPNVIQTVRPPQIVYVGSNIPVVNPIPAQNPVVMNPNSALSAAVASSNSAPSAPAVPAGSIPGSVTTQPPNSASQYLIYLNPTLNKNQDQNVIFANQNGQPFSTDDQKFLQYQLQYSNVQSQPQQKTAYNSYVVYPKKKT